MKKIISIVLFIIIISFQVSSFADDFDEEEINEDLLKEEILDTSTNVENLPKINSRAVLIFDRESKKVIYEKNGYSKRAMASTTKIMTAIIVLENAKLTDTVEISKKAGGTGGSRLGLKEKDKITVNDLLYGLMLRSRKRCDGKLMTGIYKLNLNFICKSLFLSIEIFSINSLMTSVLTFFRLQNLLISLFILSSSFC